MEYKLEESINYQIATLSIILKRQVFRIISEKGLDITPEQWVVLYYLWEENGQSVGELAKKSKKDFANATRIIDKLVKLEYVSKKKSTTDTRINNIYILPKADNIKDKIQKCMFESSDISLKGISEAEQQSLLSILNKIETNILES